MKEPTAKKILASLTDKEIAMVINALFYRADRTDSPNDERVKAFCHDLAMKLMSAP